MNMKCLDKIMLTNGLTVEILDLSRAIAEDTTKVELLFRMEIKLDESYFAQKEQWEMTRRIFGDSVFFENRIERTFVDNSDQDKVRRALIDSFKSDSLPYLSHADFARRFALAKYADIVKRPHKYQRPS